MWKRLNRNHLLLAGVVALVLGLQFRLVRTFVLNEPSANFLAEKFQSVKDNSAQDFYVRAMGTPQKYREINPPKWLGYVCLSIGAVFVLQSLAMRKPGGGGEGGE